MDASKYTAEGFYYIEWRENNRRLRQSVPNRNHVLERARLKALELDARKAGIRADGKPAPPSRPATAMIASGNTDLPSFEINQVSKAAGVFLSGVESYLQRIIDASVRSQLEALGIAPKEIATESASLPGDASDHPSITPAFAANPQKLEQLRPPVSDLETSVRKLRTYWSKASFWPVGSSGIYVMSTSQRNAYPRT